MQSIESQINHHPVVHVHQILVGQGLRSQTLPNIERALAPNGIPPIFEGETMEAVAHVHLVRIVSGGRAE